MSRIKGGEIGSVSNLKKALKKGGGGRYLERVPVDGITGRFLTEPTSWVKFSEHYDDVHKFYPCVEDECIGCAAGLSVSIRFLTNFVDTSENKVIPLVLPKTAANQIMKKYDRYGTLLDRDYEITKEGTGYDTEYDVEAEQPNKRNMKRYDPLDLMSLLEAQIPGSDTDDDEDEDEDDDEPITRRRPAKKIVRKKPPIARKSSNGIAKRPVKSSGKKIIRRRSS